jgi:putative RNA 2'-phosphotransferase
VENVKFRVTKNNSDSFGKYLSYLLRHHPDKINLWVDLDGGWTNTDDLIEKINASDTNPFTITKPVLIDIVEADEKKRFSFRDDYRYIRANSGHSIPVQLKFDEVTPENDLFHGTAPRTAKSIQQSKYIIPMNRMYVHLSDNVETAKKVGARHCKDGETPVVFRIDVKKCLELGVKFYKSENGIYMATRIPTEAIKVEE